MSLLANSNAIESGGYNIDRSLRFRSSASAYLSRAFGTPASNTTWSMSVWLKRGTLNTTQDILSANVSSIWFGSDDKLNFYKNSVGNVATSTAVFRDPSAWYHFVFISNGATVIGYCNNTQVISYTGTIPQFNSVTAHNICRNVSNGVEYFDGYLAEVNFIDGQALTPSRFGEFSTETGVWVPKKYTGTYGTNGFYLDFKYNTSATTLAYDKSGNGNNWTANNISTTAGATYDSMTDVPTLTSATAANYCTLNPLALRRDVATTVTFADGNLKATFNNAGGSATHAWGTIAPTTGKFYWEITISAAVTNIAVGIGDQVDQEVTANHSVIYIPAGGIYKYGTLQTTAASYTTNDVIGIAYDVDAGTLAYYKNNTLQYTVTGLTYIPSLPFNRGSTSDVIIANFGQRPFSYTPPTGFKALNTFNLPDPVIKKPNQYMDATTYTGNGATQSIVNAGGFAPDLVWIKSRSAVGNNWLVDSVRSVIAYLSSNLTGAESNSATSLTSFNSNGFSLGTDVALNNNGTTFVGWQWKKGATPGFDIVTYTGTGTARTVSHSLGVAPKMMIVKKRSAADSWQVYHANLTSAAYRLVLNSTNAQDSQPTIWNSTAPTSSVFSVGTDSGVNTNGGTYVAYLFAEIPGFSKFGSYTGNGSADGPFVYCGFRPKFILFKPSSTALGWNIYDTTRSPYNTTDLILQPNLSNAESASTLYIDILSNGFKLRNTLGEMNGNGTTYIFACFAESPFKTSLAR